MLHRTVKKGLWFSLGVLFLILAVIGVFLPILQGFLFFIISIFCFMRCSTRFNRWVRRQHWFERIKKHLPHRKKHDSSGID